MIYILREVITTDQEQKSISPYHAEGGANAQNVSKGIERKEGNQNVQ